MLTRTEEEKEMVRDRRVSRLERRWFRRALISVFLIFNLSAILICLLPSSSGINHGLMGFVRPYLSFTSLSQSWQMFSPNPDGTDAYMGANIIMKSGKVVYFEYPRMEKLGYITKYREERYRKFIENARSNMYDWQPMCIWLAQRYKDQQPKIIVLSKYSRPVPPPGVDFGPFAHKVVYTYNVSTGDGK
jgi:hypothetical protein